MGEMLILLVIACFVSNAIYNYNKYQPPTPSTKIRVCAKIKSTKRIEDTNFKAAKNFLVSIGYSATEAKQMLFGIRADTTEQYINKAMQKVKI